MMQQAALVHSHCIRILAFLGYAHSLHHPVAVVPVSILPQYYGWYFE